MYLGYKFSQVPGIFLLFQIISFGSSANGLQQNVLKNNVGIF